MCLPADLSLKSRSDALNTGLAIYYGQLVLNFAWSSTFFGAKQVLEKR